MSTKVVYRAMTAAELSAALALSNVRFPVASPPKRFARHLVSQACAAEPTITDRQADYLWRVVHTYRRQIPERVRALAPRREVPR